MCSYSTISQFIRIVSLIISSTVPTGTPIEHKGTDYVQIDLDQRLIYNTTSSGDSLNYFLRLGDADVINGRVA